MNFKLKKPCNTCPFRNDIAFYLRRERREEIAVSLLFGDATFPCHKTVDYEAWETARMLADATGQDENNVLYPGGERDEQCAGALIVLAKSGHLFDNVLFRLAAMVGNLDPDQLDMDSPVFVDMTAFVEVDE